MGVFSVDDLTVTSWGLGLHLALVFSGQQSLISRAKMVTVSESLATPPDVKEKIHLLYQKSKFVEKSMQNFSGERPRRKMRSAVHLLPGSALPAHSLPHLQSFMTLPLASF